jgi:hypothetical protein
MCSNTHTHTHTHTGTAGKDQCGVGMVLKQTQGGLVVKTMVFNSVMYFDLFYCISHTYMFVYMYVYICVCIIVISILYDHV